DLGCGKSQEQVAGVDCADSRSVLEPEPGRRHREFPGELRLSVESAGKHEQARERFGTRSGVVGRGPAELLQAEELLAGLDLLKLLKTAAGAGQLHPSGVHTCGDTVDLIEAVIAVLFEPQTARIRVECHAEAVAVA